MEVTNTVGELRIYTSTVESFLLFRNQYGEFRNSTKDEVFQEHIICSTVISLAGRKQ